MKIFSIFVCFLISFPAGCNAQTQATKTAEQNATETTDEFFVEPSRVIHSWSGENAGDQFGWTARRTGDLDGDDIIDLVATAPTYDRASGKIYVYSGKSGKLLFSKSGTPGERLGNSAIDAGDVNKDGVNDVIAGAPNTRNPGNAYVYSGKDGKLLLTLKGKKAGDQFGYDVCSLGDINGDGCADLAVGAIGGDGKQAGSGIVTGFSGKDGSVLFVLQGERKGDQYGNSICAQPINDGHVLIAVGAPNSGEGQRGGVYVYKIGDNQPELAFQIKNNPKDVALGQMFLSFPGDLNKDGTHDLYVSDFQSSQNKPGAGRVAVHSGVDGKLLLSIEGQIPGEGLGTSPSDAMDADGDGVGDLVIGAWQNAKGAKSGGRIYLYSCATKKLLRTWTSKHVNDTLGFDSVGIGDVDGDGHVDFLITAAWAETKGPKTGRVYIVAGEDYSQKKQP